MISPDLVMQILKYAEDTAVLVVHAIQLAKEGRNQDVATILPPTMLTTAAKLRADAEALAKFGGGQ